VTLGDASAHIPSPGAIAPRSPALPAFAHASEAELARILDFYAVRWEYEPHLFPILWNLDGAVIESFSPDFYLPDFDTYIELTTLRQPLVRKKNRKLRRLRELYPDVGIKLFYARDFRALMLKYGKLGLVDALSGTSGQVIPTRVLPIAPVERPDGLAGEPAAAAGPHQPIAADLPDQDGGARESAHSDAPAAGAVGTMAPLSAIRGPRRRRRRSPAAAIHAAVAAAESSAER